MFNVIEINQVKNAADFNFCLFFSAQSFVCVVVLCSNVAVVFGVVCVIVAVCVIAVICGVFLLLFVDLFVASLLLFAVLLQHD